MYFLLIFFFRLQWKTNFIILWILPCFDTITHIIFSLRLYRPHSFICIVGNFASWCLGLLMWALWYILIDVNYHCSGINSGLTELWCLFMIVFSSRYHTLISFFHLCLRIQLRYDMNISFWIFFLGRYADSFPVKIWIIYLRMPFSHLSILWF